MKERIKALRDEGENKGMGMKERIKPWRDEGEN